MLGSGPGFITALMRKGLLPRGRLIPAGEQSARDMIVPSQAVAVDQRPNKSEHQGGEGDQVAEGTPESLRWRGRATWRPTTTCRQR